MSKGIIMANVKEILRLHYELKLSQHEIAAIIGLSSSSVNKYLKYFTSLNLQWPISDEIITSHLRASENSLSAIDFSIVHN